MSTPKKPKKAKPKRSWLGRMFRRLLTLMLTLVLAGIALLFDGHQQLDAPLRLSEPRNFDIEAGSSLPKILANADEQGIFAAHRQAVYLGLLARIDGRAAMVKAGEYRIEPTMTPRSLLALWVSGKTVLHELQLIEGWRFADALKKVRESPVLTRTLAPDLDDAGLMTALGQPGKSPEGRLFPDTYRFSKGMSDVAFLRKALAAQEQVLAEEWASRDPNLPYDGPEQALIMASIIEKETGVAAEREQIAGVFVRRLQIGMRLQTDPTVIYGIGSTYDGNIRSRDLLTDTPYNTYTRDGLPPTPICLPGRASVHAAMHPSAGDALYFVGKGDGSHQFSATLTEHNEAVRRYQLGGRGAAQ